MKTYSAKPGLVQRKTYLIDARGKVLGRLAAEVACILRGKRKPEYTPHVDTGDAVIIINAECIEVTGKKATDKKYYRHTGYPGGIRETTFNEKIASAPESVLEIAIKGMLPKNTLGYAMFKKLRVYAGATHPHSAQQPEVLEI